MKKTVATLLLIWGLFLVGVVEAKAVAKFTLSPASGTYNVGDQIKVTVGIDSGTVKVYSADIQMVFDASKLELDDAVAVPQNPPTFQFVKGVNNIDNTAGTFLVGLGPVSSTSDMTAPAKGDLITLTFKAKAAGTATLSFVCAGGNELDTNIVNEAMTDVVNCESNQSGSYTINAGSDNNSSPTSTPVPAGATPTKTPSTLPQTGVLSPTITLLVMGMIGIIGGAFFLL